jgi:hypothetical protein
MSTINFTCPHCSFSKQLPASAEGRQGNCPSCGSVVPISSNAPSASVSAVPHPVTPTANAIPRTPSNNIPCGGCGKFYPLWIAANAAPSTCDECGTQVEQRHVQPEASVPKSPLVNRPVAPVSTKDVDLKSIFFNTAIIVTAFLLIIAVIWGGTLMFVSETPIVATNPNAPAQTEPSSTSEPTGSTKSDNDEKAEEQKSVEDAAAMKAAEDAAAMKAAEEEAAMKAAEEEAAADKKAADKKAADKKAADKKAADKKAADKKAADEAEERRRRSKLTDEQKAAEDEAKEMKLDQQIAAVTGKAIIERRDGEIVRLAFNATRGRDPSFDGLEFLATLERLETLEFNYGEIDGASFKHIENLSNLTKLSTHRTTISGPVLIHLKNLKNVTFLGLSGPTKIRDEELKYISGHRQLQSLSLNSTEITDEGLSNLQGLDSLSDLSLANTKINGSGLELLTSCPIKKLTLWSNPNVSDASIKWIATLKNSLTDISLYETAMTHDGIRKLFYLGGLSESERTEIEVLIAKTGAQLTMADRVRYDELSERSKRVNVDWSPGPNPIDLAFHKYNNWNSRPVFIDQLNVEVLRDYGEGMTFSRDRRMAVYSGNDRSNTTHRKAFTISFFFSDVPTNPSYATLFSNRVATIKQGYRTIDLGTQGLDELTRSVIAEFDRFRKGTPTKTGNGSTRVTWKYPEFKRAVIFEYFSNKEVCVELSITRTR